MKVIAEIPWAEDCKYSRGAIVQFTSEEIEVLHKLMDVCNGVFRDDYFYKDNPRGSINEDIEMANIFESVGRFYDNELVANHMRNVLRKLEGLKDKAFNDKKSDMGW